MLRLKCILTLVLALGVVLTACASATLAPAPIPPSPQVTMLPVTPSPSVKAAPTSTVLLDPDNSIYWIDLATGKSVPGFMPLAHAAAVRSADGLQMAAIQERGQSCESSGGGTACYAGANALEIIDVQTGRAVSNTLKSGGWAWPLTFSPDTFHIALALNQDASSNILLVDARTAQLVAQGTLDFRPSLLNFSQDGKLLIVYGQPESDKPGVTQPPPPRVALFDAATLEMQWEQVLPEIVSGYWCIENCQGQEGQRLSAEWNPAVIPSKDGRQLYIVHADAEKLTTVDFSARKIRTTVIQAARSWFDNFLARTADVAEAKGGAEGASKYAVLSSDGKKLYLIAPTMTAPRSADNSVWDTTYRVGDLEVIDVQSGNKLAALAMANREGVNEYLHEINLTPDGRRVFAVRSDPNNYWWTEVFDAQTLQPVAQLAKWRLLVARRVDGQPVLLAQQGISNRLAVIDPETFAVVRSFSLEADPVWVTAP
jgi:hypothetical protein